jgi:hypothetical protein
LVKHEHLVADPEDTLAQIPAFLELEGDIPSDGIDTTRRSATYERQGATLPRARLGVRAGPSPPRAPAGAWPEPAGSAGVEAGAEGGQAVGGDGDVAGGAGADVDVGLVVAVVVGPAGGQQAVAVGQAFQGLA